LYCTTGILLRRLQSEPNLSDVTHVIIDEVHERSLDTDFLMLLLRRALRRGRPDLKLILMSATMDADKLSRYFDGAPVLTVPGRTFPVDIRYVEDAVELCNYHLDPDSVYRLGYDECDDGDESGAVGGASLASARGGSADPEYTEHTQATVDAMDENKINLDLIEQLILTAVTPGATLVFLPGLGDILALHSQLLSNPDVYESGRFVVVALHSTVSAKEQAQAFIIPPPGQRKVVISTNIAETGITIPDCTLVIDSCKVKEVRFQSGERAVVSSGVYCFAMWPVDRYAGSLLTHVC
jgi:ATP-dependent RNA helicase DHX29